MVAIGLGLRRGELLALRWQSVDLNQGWLRVEETLERIDGQLILWAPKSARSRRTLALPGVCLDALKDQQARQNTWRESAVNWTESGLVFTTMIGTPIEPRNLNRHFGTVRERTDVPPVRFHDLRHTCATLLLASGEQPRVIMHVLGHSMISTTLDLYAHVLPASHLAAARRMDDVFKGAGCEAVATSVAVPVAPNAF